jgi:exo-1,4-beta-D-glucosaminidase
VYFLQLSTQNQAGRTCAENFYWLSAKPDVLDEAKATWYVTPEKSFADFSALNQLPAAMVDAAVDFQFQASQPTRSVVTLTNRSDHLAFFIEMRIVDKESQQSMTPVIWDDNYVSLPPHAQKTYFALLPSASTKAELKLQGWNVRFGSNK